MCGKCCLGLGTLITVERQLNERDYYCRSKIDNAIFLAHVDPAYSEEIADEFLEEDNMHFRSGKKTVHIPAKEPDQWRKLLCDIFNAAESLPGFPLLPDAHL